MENRPGHEDRRGRAHRPDERPPVGPQEGEDPPLADQVEGGEHAQHQELALGEVDDPHDAEDEAEADAHQTVDAPDRDARRDGVEDVLDEYL
jgi:hypothetical protein